MSEMTLVIPRIAAESINLPLGRGQRIFIVGANGTGKSALIHQFVRKHMSSVERGRIKWIAAHRRTWFESGGTDFTPLQRQGYDENRSSYDSTAEARWKDGYADANVSAVLFDLMSKQSDRAETIANSVDDGELQRAKEHASELPSPLSQINDLLKLGRLKVFLQKGENQTLLARHENGNTYSIAEMSDAERSAMFLAAQVITASADTVFLIDEPERHLHRSIIVPLLSALFSLRRGDCTFVISTHETALPVANPDAAVLMLRSCQWNDAECVAWDADVLKTESDLPEDLKFAILGARGKILFVEGEDASLDRPFYRALFPDVRVEPKGTCQDVERAVRGLRSAADLHRVEAFGVIDRDNRDKEDVSQLAKVGVFALDVCSVEGFYYCSDAIAAVARRQADSLGCDADELIEAATKQAFEKLQNREVEKRMAARRCEREIRESLLSKLPDWKSIMESPAERIGIATETGYGEEIDRYNKLVQAGDLDGLLARYPLDETGAFKQIADALKCASERDYEDNVVARIRDDDKWKASLKRRLGGLYELLDSVENADSETPK